MSNAVKNLKMLSEDELQEKLKELQDLISSNERMPHNINELLLIRYLKFFNGNTEKALKRLMASMEIRKYWSNIYHSRDPQDPRLRKLIDQILMFLLPKVTVENNRIMVLKLIDFDADNLVVDDAITVFSMVYDATLITREENRLADGEILILDLDGITARHLTRISFSSLRCFFRYMHEAHPMRIQQIHLVNCSPMLDRLLTLCRPLMGSKTLKVMHFHMPDSTTLFDFVPRDLLPTEFGGTDGSLEGPKWHWIRRTEDCRDFLLDNDQWTLDLSDRSEGGRKLNVEDDGLMYMGFC